MPIRHETATVAITVPDAVLAYSQEKGIRGELERALEMVRDAFPDLVQPEVVLEDHEVLGRVIRIDGKAPGPPTVVAQRVWDCVGEWAAVLPRQAFMYLQLGILPEGE